MAKNNQVNEPKKKSKLGGCLKSLFFLVIFTAVIYAASHIYFLFQPADELDKISEAVMGAQVMGVKAFPAIQTFPLKEIDGREEILKGWLVKTPALKERLQNAVEQNYPVTFREDEINAWLSKRLTVKQGGLLAPLVNESYMWIDLREGEMELVIERNFKNDVIHVTSLMLKFTRIDKGYSIQPFSSHIGQVRAPGGFARLIMPSYMKILDELSEELQPYNDKKIYDIHVEEGKITIDPRTAENRL